MNDPQDKGRPYSGGDSGYRSAPNPVKAGLGRSTAQSNQPAQNGRPASRRSQAAPRDVPGSRNVAIPRNVDRSRNVPGSQAPRASYDGPDPKTLAGYFQQAKDSGDITRARGYGRWLQRQFNWEYGEGPGGWPYIKA